MKAKDFAQFFKRFSQMLLSQGGDNAGAWNELAKVFEARPTATVADVCKHLKAAKLDPAGEPDLGNLIKGINQIETLLAAHAKKSLLDDLGKLADALVPHRNASTERLSSVVIPALQTLNMKPAKARSAELNVGAVERYLRRLETALGDETGFAEVFDALKNDKTIKASEAKRLAREFAKGAAGSKDKALKLIWGRHASLIEARAKGAATAGRTAA